MAKKYELNLISTDIQQINAYSITAFQTICDFYNDDNFVCELLELDDDIDEGSNKDDKDSERYKIYERNYIISLASIFAEKRVNLSNSNVELHGYINGEVAKKLHLNHETHKQTIQDKDRKYLEKYIKIKQMFKEDYKAKEQIHVFPDFLIHDSNSFDSDKVSRETQHLIMEAKTTKITDEKYFWLDFLKLNFYIEKLQFDNAVYLIIGTPLSSINTYIQNYMNKIGVTCGDEIHRLFFIVQESLKSEPKLYQIKEILI